MREIIFKAKKVDNGEWVEGSFVKAELLDGSGFEYVIIEVEAEGKTHKIDESTICQYTGLTDKNGRKIWENDILDCKDRVTVVKWRTPCGTWDSVFVRYKGELCSNGIRVVEWKYRAEVIGNIFDNPELLKGGGAEC